MIAILVYFRRAFFSDAVHNQEAMGNFSRAQIRIIQKARGRFAQNPPEARPIKGVRS
jgi:hypothetical protein